MEVSVVTGGPLEANSYVVCQGRECVVVDPVDAAGALRAVGDRRVVALVATHLHFDHVTAVGELARRLAAPFYAHRADWEAYWELNRPAREWGFPVPELPTPEPVGERLWELQVLHTPGHTPGSISLVGPGFVLTGDTLFAGTVGRTDLPGGDWDALVRSVCRLYGLPEHYVVYPGHGPSTTVGREARWNLVSRADCP